MRGRRVRGALIGLAGLGAVATLGLALLAGGDAGAASSGTTVTVRAGMNAKKDPNLAVTEFLPAKITVQQGSTVKWSWKDTIEPHSTTFLAPGQTLPPPGSDEALFLPTPPTGPYTGQTLVNSGLWPLGPGAVPPFELTFPDTGKFTYYCVIHPGMIGSVNVVAGKGDTQKEIDKRGRVEQKKWVAEGVKAKADLERTRFVKKNADGSKTFTVQMGTTTEHVDVLAFAPAPTRITAGDSVKFVNNSLAPHTATAVGEQPAITDPLSPQAEEAIPGPSPQTLNATALFNTGLVPPKAPGPPEGKPPPKAARSYTWVVPDTGRYAYYCILHTLSGMGTEIVAR